MQGSNRNPSGLSGRQITLLGVLAVITLVVIIGAGYYILRDTGVIGDRSPGTAASLPTSDAEKTDDAADATDTPDDSSVGLPPAWTPTTFGISEIDSTQWALQLSDLPLGFIKEQIDGMDTPPEILSEDAGVTFVNSFAFAKEGDSPQFVIGFTMLVPDSISKAEFDEIMLDPDILIEEFITSLEHNGILEQQEIDGLGNIGDASFGMSFALDMESVEMRVELLTFRRGVAGAFLLTMHVDGFSADVLIQDLAAVLDQRIIPTLPTGQ